MLHNSKESQDWVRNNKRGHIFGVLELGSEAPGELFTENENTPDIFQYSDYETEKMQGPSPLSLLYQSWFLKRQENVNKQEMQTKKQAARAKVTKWSHNGHQPTPKPQGLNTKHTNYGKSNPFSKPKQQSISLPQHEETPNRFYHKTLTSYEEDKRPSLSFLLLEFLPRQLVLAVQAIGQNIGAKLRIMFGNKR
jgi:hypothetical protein